MINLGFYMNTISCYSAPRYLYTVHIDILRTIDYLSQLMYKSSILYRYMSAARQQVDQSTGVPGRMKQASKLTVLDGRLGGPGQFLQILQTARSFLKSHFTRKVRQVFW